MGLHCLLTDFLNQYLTVNTAIIIFSLVKINRISVMAIKSRHVLGLLWMFPNITFDTVYKCTNENPDLSEANSKCEPKTREVTFS